MQIYLKNRSSLDLATDARAIAERVPAYVERFDALAEIRKEVDPLGEFYSRLDARMRPLASIPEAVVNIMLAVDPDFLKDRNAFIGWLEAHPEYKRRA